MNSGGESQIQKCSNFKVSNFNGIEYLACLQQDHKLTLYDINLTRIISFSDVKDYLFSDRGNTLLVKSEFFDNENTYNSIEWLDIATMAKKNIWYGTPVNNIVFDKSGSKVAFTALQNYLIESPLELWYYDKKMASSQPLVTNSNAGFSTSWKITDRPPNLAQTHHVFSFI